VTEIFLGGMASGVRILGTVTKPCKIKRVGAATFRIVLTQGLNRQIRRMCSFFGYKVLRLQRVRIINIALGDLKPGQWRHLQPVEVRGLLPDKPDFNF
jgi:23S rRNA pseudouridine2604 synthase